MTVELTQNGIDALLYALEEQKPIVFDRIILGNGADAGNNPKTLSNPQLNSAINKDIERSTDGDFVTLTCSFSNSNIQSRFRVTETGVTIKDPSNNSKTVLFAYGYVDDSIATVIPAPDDGLFEITQRVIVYVGATANVSKVVLASSQYAAKDDFDKHTQNANNPHGVTAAQVGLGNVPNVTTNNQTPTYDTPDAVEALTSGEKLSAAFGKIKAAVAALISHLANKDNPHAVTPGKIGAAEKYHLHSAADINSGILGVARGGTGASTYAQLMENLRTASASYVCGTHTGDGAAQITVGLPFTPSVVWWYPLDGIAADGNYAALAVGKPDGTGAGGQANLSGTTYGPYTQGSGTMLFLSTNGFRVYYDAAKKIYTNKDGKKYGYVAIR